MNGKHDRLRKIKNFLRMQSSSVTVSEIHDALSRRMNLDISRKTIERDVYEMAEKDILTCLGGVPSRYSLNRPSDIEIVLKIEEVQTILKNLEPSSTLYLKLKRAIE